MQSGKRNRATSRSVTSAEPFARQFSSFAPPPHFHSLSDPVVTSTSPRWQSHSNGQLWDSKPAADDPILSRRVVLRSGLAALMSLGVLSKTSRGNESSSISANNVDAAAASAPAGSSTTNAAAPDPRDIAKQIIPFERLTGQTQERLWSVINRTSMYRRLPEQAIVCDPDLYLFFLRNPEVVVNMWQLLGVTSMQLKRMGNFVFDAKDNAGTQARLELVYGTPDTHIFLADGAYEGQLLKRRTPGRCVIVLKTDYGREPAPQAKITSQLDAFMQVDPTGADLVVRTLQPVIGRTADHNFRETLSFVSRVSQALERSSLGVPHLASKLTALDPPVRDKFVQVATNVHHRAILRTPEGHSELPLTSDVQQQPIAPVQALQPGTSRPVIPVRRAG